MPPPFSGGGAAAARPSLAFHALLRQARVEAGLTQAQAADRLGLTQSQVSLYENGLRCPPLPRAFRMLMILGWQLTGQRMDDQGDPERLLLGLDRAGNRRYWGSLDGPLVLLGDEPSVLGYLASLGSEGVIEPVEDPERLAALARDRRRVVVHLLYDTDLDALDQSLTVLSVTASTTVLSVGGQRVGLTP